MKRQRYSRRFVQISTSPTPVGPGNGTEDGGDTGHEDEPIGKETAVESSEDRAEECPSLLNKD